jgi:hypothetical protein
MPKISEFLFEFVYLSIAVQLYIDRSGLCLDGAQKRRTLLIANAFHV